MPESIIDASKSAPVVMFGRDTCPYCVSALAMLKRHVMSKSIRYIDVTKMTDKERSSMMRMSGLDSIPQIYIQGRLIGGASELEGLLKIFKIKG